MVMNEPAMVGDQFRKNGVVATHGGLHRKSSALPFLRAAVDVGEEVSALHRLLKTGLRRRSRALGEHVGQTRHVDDENAGALDQEHPLAFKII